MRKLIAFLIAFLPLVALAAPQTITANGNYGTTTCEIPKAQVEVFDGGGGYDSGVVTLQAYSRASDAWETACPTASDCQWSSGDSGMVQFEFYKRNIQLRLNLAGVVSAADIDVNLECYN